MAIRAQISLGIVGFGEVGSGLALGLRGEGLERVCAYDTGAFSGPFGDLIRRRAEDAGVQLVESPEDLVASCDLIIMATPGSASVSVAESLSPFVTESHLCVDLAAATPKVKARGGELRSAPSRALVADGAIMSSPLEDGHRILILASGPGAQQFADTLVPWGMRIRVVGEKLGAATGIKTLRTVFMKGIEALMIECALGSGRYGIQDEVFGSIAEWMDQRPFMTTANLLMVTDAIHAKRRANETDMSVEALLEAGIDPIMTRATAERLHWVARAGSQGALRGCCPGTIRHGHRSHRVQAFRATG